MFGLMRAKKCGMSDEEKHFRRLNYCGTCKTIGTIYGQKSRLLLNHDVVFLAEVLTTLSGEDTGDWQKSYQSYNCLSLPKDSMPVALQFAATTNIILTGFKLADHISDEGKRRFVFAQKAFSKEFKKAGDLLKTWNFPLDKIEEILQTQNEREAKNLSLEDLAEPTARTTAEFFAHGAGLIGKDVLKNTVYEIGFAFGKLIYILDAFEDYEKDFRKNQFNALRSVFHLKEDKIPAGTKRSVTAALRRLENEIAGKIYELPIHENQKALFAWRLKSNLQRKLKTELPVLKTAKVCRPKIKQTWSQRWSNASKTAGELAKNYSWQMPLVFLFVFAFALAAPAQTKEAKSARECFDLSFNLMFLGAVFASVIALPKTIRMQSPDELKEKAQEAAAGGAAGGPVGTGVGIGVGTNTGANAGGSGDVDTEGCCDTCECCCCGCDECGWGGCCDNCDCCSGCCDNCDCGGCCDCDC